MQPVESKLESSSIAEDSAYHDIVLSQSDSCTVTMSSWAVEEMAQKLQRKHLNKRGKLFNPKILQSVISDYMKELFHK